MVPDLNGQVVVCHPLDPVVEMDLVPAFSAPCSLIFFFGPSCLLHHSLLQAGVHIPRTPKSHTARVSPTCREMPPFVGQVPDFRNRAQRAANPDCQALRWRTTEAFIQPMVSRRFEPRPPLQENRFHLFFLGRRPHYPQLSPFHVVPKWLVDTARPLWTVSGLPLYAVSQSRFCIERCRSKGRAHGRHASGVLPSPP